MNQAYEKNPKDQKIINFNPDKRPSPEHNSDKNRTEGKGHKRSHGRLLIGVIILLNLSVIAWFYYQKNHLFTSCKTIWETKNSEKGLTKYEVFGSNVLEVTRDGVSYIDGKGETIWRTSYQMQHPTVSVKGDYAAIADMRGNTIYICNSEGVQGYATTVFPIGKVAVSGIGMVAAIVGDSTSSQIDFFRKDGSVIDLTIAPNIVKSGYPFDISLSGDGTQLMASYVFIQKGELKNRVVFYDFSEIGKSVENRLVGGFDKQFQGAFVGAVQYMDTPFSCAFSTNGISFFSSKNLRSPAHIAQVFVEEEIQSVFHSEDYAGVIVKNNSGDYASRMEIYKKSGELAMKKDFTYDYTNVDIDGDLVILYNQDSCMIYNMNGVLKLNISFDFCISQIRRGNSFNTLILIGSERMRKIKLR